MTCTSKTGAHSIRSTCQQIRPCWVLTAKHPASNARGIAFTRVTNERRLGKIQAKNHSTQTLCLSTISDLLQNDSQRIPEYVNDSWRPRLICTWSKQHGRPRVTLTLDADWPGFLAAWWRFWGRLFLRECDVRVDDTSRYTAKQTSLTCDERPTFQVDFHVFLWKNEQFWESLQSNTLTWCWGQRNLSSWKRSLHLSPSRCTSPSNSAARNTQNLTLRIDAPHGLSIGLKFPAFVSNTFVASVSDAPWGRQWWWLSAPSCNAWTAWSNTWGRSPWSTTWQTRSRTTHFPTHRTWHSARHKVLVFRGSMRTSCESPILGNHSNRLLYSKMSQQTFRNSFVPSCFSRISVCACFSRAEWICCDSQIRKTLHSAQANRKGTPSAEALCKATNTAVSLGHNVSSGRGQLYHPTRDPTPTANHEAFVHLFPAFVTNLVYVTSGPGNNSQRQQHEQRIVEEETILPQILQQESKD